MLCMNLNNNQVKADWLCDVTCSLVTESPHRHKELWREWMSKQNICHPHDISNDTAIQSVSFRALNKPFKTQPLLTLCEDECYI